MEMIQKETMKQWLIETSSKPESQKKDKNLILKLVAELRANNQQLTSLGMVTPIIATIKNIIDGNDKKKKDKINNAIVTEKSESTQFAKFLPEKWIEPLTIIARIKGYNGIDDYILNLIRGRLQMFVDTADTVEWEKFQEYMHNTIIIKGKKDVVKNPWAREDDVEEESDAELSSAT